MNVLCQEEDKWVKGDSQNFPTTLSIERLLSFDSRNCAYIMNGKCHGSSPQYFLRRHVIRPLSTADEKHTTDQLLKLLTLNSHSVVRLFGYRQENSNEASQECTIDFLMEYIPDCLTKHLMALRGTNESMIIPIGLPIILDYAEQLLSAVLFLSDHGIVLEYLLLKDILLDGAIIKIGNIERHYLPEPPVETFADIKSVYEKVCYIAPETIHRLVDGNQDDPIYPNAITWSFGCIVLNMALRGAFEFFSKSTGEHFMPNGNSSILLQRRLDGWMPFVPFELPADMLEIVDMCLKTENRPVPQQILQHIGEIRQTPTNFKNEFDCPFRFESADFKNLALLGTGTYSTVHKVLHVPSAKIMARKFFLAEAIPKENRHFLTDIKLLMDCSSPFIINLYGITYERRRLTILMEYMDAGSAEQLTAPLVVKGHKIPGIQVPETVLSQISFCIISAIQYLETQGILHREIKPSNILLNTKGEVKLCYLSRQMHVLFAGPRDRLSTTYLAPERLKGEKSNPASDIWSLGLSLMQLAIARYPIPYPTDEEFTAIFSGTKRVSDLRKSVVSLESFNYVCLHPPPSFPYGVVSDEFKDFVDKCLKKEPHERPSLNDLYYHAFVVHRRSRSEDVAEWIASVQTIRLKKTSISN